MTKILVIEDELYVRENIVDLLEAEDFEVFSTDNGILGILWAQENMPDLVICDVMMPEINGHDVLAEMRQLPNTELTPFIFLTAMSDKEDIRLGMELGADDYLTKPFTRDEILRAITSRLLKHAKLMKQYHEEHLRFESLATKVQELEALEVQHQLSHQLEQALLKINTAVNLIEKIQPGNKRERNLKFIQQTYTAEIALIQQNPNLKSKICAQNQTLSLIFSD